MKLTPELEALSPVEKLALSRQLLEGIPAVERPPVYNEHLTLLRRFEDLFAGQHVESWDAINAACKTWGA